MKRCVVVGVATLAVASPGTASASHQPNGVGGPFDFAAGAGRVLGPDQFFNVSGRIGPQGPNGEMTLDRGPTRIKAEVNCVSVSVNTATVQGTIRKSNDPLGPVGSQLTFYLEDNGEPGAGTDRFTAHFAPLCRNPLAAISARTLVTGNLVVHEGS